MSVRILGRNLESYELEKRIVNKGFYGNLSDHFYQFCESLPTNWNLSENKQSKIQRLKDSARDTRRKSNDLS
ncbi:hypothetical protein [Helicobacter trogontum]